MEVLQISKYPVGSQTGPTLRNSWFSYGHIGQERGGRLLTRDEFLDTEEKYWLALQRFMAGASLSRLRAHEVEHWDEGNASLTQLGLEDIFDGSRKPADGEELSGHRLSNAFRRCFREAAWLEFYWERRFLVHLGHDLRLTIATDGSIDRESVETRNDGLFVRPGPTNLPTLEAWRRIDAGW
jgi:hypothetical protein